MSIEDSVYLDHISWHTKQATEDATAKNIRLIFGRLQHNPEYNVDKKTIYITAPYTRLQILVKPSQTKV